VESGKFFDHNNRRFTLNMFELCEVHSPLTPSHFCSLLLLLVSCYKMELLIRATVLLRTL